MSREPDAARIRAWARAHDVPCPARGKIPASIREAFYDAQEATA